MCSAMSPQEVSSRSLRTFNLVGSTLDQGSISIFFKSYSKDTQKRSSGAPAGLVVIAATRLGVWLYFDRLFARTCDLWNDKSARPALL